MRRLSVPALFLVLTRYASADQDPTTSPSAGLQPAAAATPEPAPAAHPPPAPVDTRAGFHIGGSIGGAYLPISEGLTALVLRGDLNWGRSNGELRVSPVVFGARQGDDPSYGLGGVVERRWYASPRMSVGIGAMTALVFDEGASFAIGPCATPFAVRFGARRNLEAAVEVFLLRNISTGSNLPGGYVSLTYLAL